MPADPLCRILFTRILFTWHPLWLRRLLRMASVQGSPKRLKTWEATTYQLPSHKKTLVAVSPRARPLFSPFLVAESADNFDG